MTTKAKISLVSCEIVFQIVVEYVDIDTGKVLWTELPMGQEFRIDVNDLTEGNPLRKGITALVEACAVRALGMED